MAKIPYGFGCIDECAYENATRKIIARESPVKYSVMIGELFEEDDPDELAREFRERL